MDTNGHRFESYIRGSEPDKKEKASAWKTAIGLQAVDGLQTSDYLKDTAIKHLRSIGFDVNNDLFADNSWYFRNALIRANYRNVRKEVEPDMSFLNLFFRNLMMGENHELKNGFVAPLYPNNPKHPRQKYLLTVKGLAIFNSTK